MATRFTVTDHRAAAAATRELPAAANALAGRISAAVAALAELEEHATAREVLAALAAWRRAQRRLAVSEGELLRLLVACGATSGALAAALGMNRATVAARIAAAVDARTAEAVL